VLPLDSFTMNSIQNKSQASAPAAEKEEGGEN